MYEVGINVINMLIESLTNTKQILESENVLNTSQLYGNFNLLSLVYSTILETYGEDELEQFQLLYIKNVIKIIKDYIKADAMYLTTEKEDGYYIIKGSISYNRNMIDVFYINPYFKKIIILNDKDISVLQDKLTQLYETEEQILNEIERLQLAKTNPIYYAGEDTVLLAKMTFQKNKYANIINNEITEKNNELLDIKREIADVEVTIENGENDNKKIYNYRDRYIDRLKKQFHFGVMKEETIDKINKINNEKNQETQEIQNDFKMID